MDNMHQPIYHRKPPHRSRSKPSTATRSSRWAAYTGRTPVPSRASSPTRSARGSGTTSSHRRGTPAPCWRATSATPARSSRSATPATTCCLRPGRDIRAATRASLGIAGTRPGPLRADVPRLPGVDDNRAAMADFFDFARALAARRRHVLLIRGHAFNARPGGASAGWTGRRRHRLPGGLRPLPRRGRGGRRLLLAAVRLRRHRQADDLPRCRTCSATRTPAAGCSTSSRPRPAPWCHDRRGGRPPARPRRRAARTMPPRTARFRDDFLDLDDGHAAERLVDQVFMVEGWHPEIGRERAGRRAPLTKQCVNGAHRGLFRRRGS